MARPPVSATDPFDWDPKPKPAPRVGGSSDEGSAAPGPRVYQVIELTRVIKTRLEDLGRVAVEGEVTRITTAASGHVYFDLKDLDAKIACTIWKSAVPTAVRFPLKEGQKVVAHGKLDVYAPRGTYSLNVARLEQAGLGALLVQLEERRQRLKELGWFDRHRPLPELPRTIGVVTSRDGAAFQDFLRTRTLRWPLYPVRLAHSSVQGAAAAGELAAAIARLDASGVDVIVVCRGGGSLEDLWAFNEMPVLEAIRATRVPVVSGVGHETDTTLCDLVADVRAHTPTDAAQTVIPDRAQCQERVERAHNELLRALDSVLEERAQRLERAAGSPVLRDPRWILAHRAERVAGFARALSSLVAASTSAASRRIEMGAARLARQSPSVSLARAQRRLEGLVPRLKLAVDRPLEARIRRLDLCERSLVATSPLQVLARGYSITRVRGGAVVTDASALAVGDVLETRVAQGAIVSRVEGTSTPAGTEDAARAAPKKRSDRTDGR